MERQRRVGLRPMIAALNWAIGAWLAIGLVVMLSLILSGVGFAQASGQDGQGGQLTQIVDITNNQGVVDMRPVGRETGLPIPRFVSFRNEKTNMRVGPGIEFELTAVYNRKGLPVQVLAESGHWREVQDWEGTRGWVHKDLLSSRRMARVADSWVEMRRQPNQDAAAMAELARGVLTQLKSCHGNWCIVEVEKISGWLPRSQIFGAFTHEDFS